MASTARRPTRTPGYLNLAAALAVLLAVLATVLRAVSAQPPAVAEFAPQAQPPIKQAPAEQTSTFGAAPGGLPGAGPAASPSPPPGDVVYRQCVGDPPRQIEDPQSPPCVAYWKGANGGSTWKGVSDSTIDVAIASNQYVAPLTDDLITFFNKRFEFYGRHLRLHQFTSSANCSNSPTPCGSTTSMYTDAQQIDQLDSPFGVLGYGQGGADDGSDYYFFDQLAARKIMSIAFSDKEGAPFVDQSHFDQYAPYEWSYLPTLDDDLNAMGSFVCTQLAARPPAYAGAPTNSAAKRKFGLVVQDYQTALQPNLQPFTSAAAACGQPVTVVRYQPTQQSQVNALVQLQSAGVTSILCVCQVNVLTESLFPAASGQQYFPEWLVTNYGIQDDNFEMTFYGENTDPAQTQHVLGLMGFNKWLSGPQMPVSWAVESVAPADGCPKACYNWEVWAAYWDLLVLASGIQMAGPNLTPAAFQKGLFRTAFPNPGCGAAPYYQACVGFGPHDHTMIQDYAMVWWSNTAPEPDYFEGQTQPGAYCYIGLGRRFRLTWPKQPQPLFDARAPCQ